MPTFPSSVSEVVQTHEMEEITSHHRHSSKKPPKGILKNANPNASYHKPSSSRHGKTSSGMNKRIEDLIEYERPRASPPQTSQRHVCTDDEEDKEENSSSGSSPSSPSSITASEVSSRRHDHRPARDSSAEKHGHRHHHGHKSKHRSHRSSRSSGGLSDASEKNDSDTSERSKRRSSSSTSSTGHRHHRHHHKSRSSGSGSIREAESADRVAWTEQSDEQSSKRSHRRHRTQEIASDIDDENNIYDMPKMPPVPVALPPPSRYANEEKVHSDKSKRDRAVESLYKTVNKSSPKSKHVSKSLQTREDENIEDLYAQDSLIQAEDPTNDGHHAEVHHDEAGFYENIGFELASQEPASNSSKKDFGTLESIKSNKSVKSVDSVKSNKPTDSIKSNKLTDSIKSAAFNLPPPSDIFDQKFITVEEALAISESGKRSPTEPTAEALYDVPRSNRRVSLATAAATTAANKQQLLEKQLATEAIYVNDNFVVSEKEEGDCTYDVPAARSEDLILIGQSLSQSFDVPRTRDSLSTIEEEHQEYEVPRAAVEAARSATEAAAAAKFSAQSSQQQTTADSAEEENFYENTLTHSNKHRGLLRESDIYIVEEAPKSSDYGSHGGDDRSSGYRSSSSPSIQSTEELYVNESAIGSMEDSHASSPELVTRRTTPRIAESSSFESLKRTKDKEFEQKRDQLFKQKEEIFQQKEERNNQRDLFQQKEEINNQRDLFRQKEERNNQKEQERNQNREKERQQVNEAEKSILKKKEVRNGLSSQPPRAFFTDFVSNKIVEPRPEIEIGTKERRKKFEAPAPPPAPPPAPAVTKPAEEKKSIQKDRSVDVYNETVRQRVSRNGGVELTLSKDVFSPITDSKTDSDEPAKSYIKKRRAPQPSHKCNVGVSDINDDDLPSVRQLRNKFENEQRFASDTKLNVVPLSSKKREALNKLSFKKGFNVVSSLTRRGASALSVSMHNLSYENTDFSNESSPVTTTSATSTSGTRKSSGPKKRPNIIMQFEKLELEETSRDQPSNNARGAQDQTGNTAHDKSKPEPELVKEEKPHQSSRSSKRPEVEVDDDVIKKDVTSGFAWNPAEVVSRMYAIETIEDDLDEEQGDDSNLEGYLERLPPGKKKSTIWNSWKRQYFVAKNGLLLIFGDQTRQVLMDRIELFGGRVDFMESTMLGIQDRRGHYVVIKCGDAKIATEWERAISKHVRRDFAKTFVIPVGLPKAPKLFSDVLVVDFGGASVRAGIAATTGPTLPRLFFPTVMAVGRSNEAEKYFGFDAFAPEIRSRCSLRQPMAPSGKIDKLSVDLTALQGIFEKIFKDLDVDPSNFEIQLSAPRSFGENVKRSIAAMLFDEFSVKAVNMAHQTVFAMRAYNAKSGVVVDLGERMDVVPVVDGYKVSSGVSRSSVGGSEMRAKLQHHLQGRNYSLGSFVDSYLLRYAIESSAYMSRNFDKELERYRQNPSKIDQIVDVSTNVTMELGSERFEACEGLFKPELWGLDQAGVHVLVHKAIRECGVDVRKEVTQSIFLAGGLTLIPGFKERLELEVEKLTPAKPRVHASPYRYHAAYLGACVHASTEAYEETKVKRRNWTIEAQKLEKIWNL